MNEFTAELSNVRKEKQTKEEGGMKNVEKGQCGAQGR
jgi:hypothetical protein